MRWGFGREAGPFDTCDMLGVAETAQVMPNPVKPGGDVEAKMEYSVLGAGPGQPVTEVRSLQRDGLFILLGHVFNLLTIAYFALLIGGGGYALISFIQRLLP